MPAPPPPPKHRRSPLPIFADSARKALKSQLRGSLRDILVISLLCGGSVSTRTHTHTRHTHTHTHTSRTCCRQLARSHVGPSPSLHLTSSFLRTDVSSRFPSTFIHAPPLPCTPPEGLASCSINTRAPFAAACGGSHCAFRAVTLMLGCRFP